MTARNTQAERLAVLETNSKNHQDNTESHFKMIEEKIDKVDDRVSGIEKRLTGIEASVKIFASKWLLLICAISLVLAGVGLTLSVMLGVDVTKQISAIRNITK